MANGTVVVLFVAALLAGCKNYAQNPADSAGVQAAAVEYTDPPKIDPGISVERAYEAIPHRRTVWDQNDTTVPAPERAYLSAMFQVLDEAVAVRVAGMQDDTSGHFEYADPVAEYGQLLSYVQAMKAPKALAAYHQDIITGLAAQRQFFADWKSQGAGFPYAQQVANHPEVQKASAALRAAYNELMAKYPNETQNNKDAFFDYHCALDFL